MDTSETLALLALGKEAWNDWAEEMLAQKSKIPQALGQAGREAQSGAGMAWADQARADFRGLIFSEECSFTGFLFPGEAEFGPLFQKGAAGPSKMPTCFQKDVIFDGARFLGPAQFLGTIFKEQASFRDAEFLGRVDFRDASFGGDAHFNLAKFDEGLFADAKFEGNAAFGYAAFSGANGSSFHRVTFFGKAMFRGASFSGPRTFFSEAEFLSDADFCEANFSDDVRVDNAKFLGDAHFSRASFHIARFEKASFTKAAHFGRATFSGYTSFQGAVFKQAANFEGVRSEGDFALARAVFLERPNFDGASFARRAKPDPQILAQRPQRRSQKPDIAAFYDISSDYIQGGAVGWKFVNYQTVQRDWHGICRRAAWPDGYLTMPRGPWLLADFAETPRFLIDRKLGRPPRDLESTDGVFLVSPAMKGVLEAIDPEACEFRPCETVLPSGEPGRETWLCAITRAFAGAVDERASVDLRIRPGPNNLPCYSLSYSTQLSFIKEIVGSAHLFHIAEMASYIFCDQAVRDACGAAGLKGILFRRVT